MLTLCDVVWNKRITYDRDNRDVNSILNFKVPFGVTIDISKLSDGAKLGHCPS